MYRLSWQFAINSTLEVKVQDFLPAKVPRTLVCITSVSSQALMKAAENARILYHVDAELIIY